MTENLKSKSTNEVRLNCTIKCDCKKPDFNDTYWNHFTNEPCVHCDICGGVP